MLSSVSGLNHMVILVKFVRLDFQNYLPETSNRSQYHQRHTNKNARLKNM